MDFSLSWIDHDEVARERSLRILALFQERESREELGLGGVRDSFSDTMFPGTSTIQTRLRYMLFVPWIYQKMESKRVDSAEIAAKARKEEVRLIQPLLDTEDERGGVFGRMAGGGLKRLPWSIYWNGLGSWGIRLFQGFQDHYHRSLDAIYRRRDLLKVKDPGDDDSASPVATWSPKIPSPLTRTVKSDHWDCNVTATSDADWKSVRYNGDRIEMWEKCVERNGRLHRVREGGWTSIQRSASYFDKITYVGARRGAMLYAGFSA